MSVHLAPPRPLPHSTRAGAPGQHTGWMRVLLVNSNRLRVPWPMIPFGLCRIAAALENAGYAVRVLDLCFSEAPAEDIRSSVTDFEPDLIGVSVRNIDNGTGYRTKFFLEDVRRDVIGPCREAFDGPIVIGGPAVGINAEEMLEFFDLEYAIRGDGEEAIVELLRRMERGQSIRECGGLVLRSGGEIVESNPPRRAPDLDILPWSRTYRYVDTARYARYGSPLQIQTKRGCALGCTYCAYARIEGRRWRLRDPEDVADEIEDMVRRTGVREVEFTDSTFNYPLDHTKEVLRAIASRGLDLKLRAMGLNPGAVDEELADLLVAAGLKETDLGAESGCETTLRGLGKNFSREELFQAGEILRRKGIPLTWYLLFGGPDETPETVRETLQTIGELALPSDLVVIAVGLRVYRGSPLAERMLRRDPGCTADTFLRPVTYAPKGIGIDQLKAMVKQESLRHHNYLMYDEDEEFPLWFVGACAWFIKRFMPDQPMWRLYHLVRTLEMASGINAVKRAVHYLKSRRILPALPETREPGILGQELLETVKVTSFEKEL